MRCLLSFQACLVGLLLHVDLVLPTKIQSDTTIQVERSLEVQI